KRGCGRIRARHRGRRRAIRPGRRPSVERHRRRRAVTRVVSGVGGAGGPGIPGTIRRWWGGGGAAGWGWGAPGRGRGGGRGLPREPGDDHPAAERVQVVELPPVRAEVTEYRLAARRCRGCGALTRAARPAEASGGAFGPRLHAVATLLVGRYRLSRREAVAC